jgi:hypothetical protein
VSRSEELEAAHFCLLATSLNRIVPPSLPERAGCSSVESATVLTFAGPKKYGIAEHLDALRKAGLVTWDNGHCRTLRPTWRFLPAESLDLAICDS